MIFNCRLSISRNHLGMYQLHRFVGDDRHQRQLLVHLVHQDPVQYQPVGPAVDHITLGVMRLKIGDQMPGIVIIIRDFATTIPVYNVSISLYDLTGKANCKSLYIYYVFFLAITNLLVSFCSLAGWLAGWFVVHVTIIYGPKSELYLYIYRREIKNIVTMSHDDM